MKVDHPTERRGQALTASILQRPDPPDPRWYCHIDRVTCRRGHPYTHHKTGYHVKDRRDGHVWLACELCTPTSFMFGIAIVRPGLFIAFHDISQAQFDYWANNPEELPDDPKLGCDPTLEILHYLGYAPRYRPFYHPSPPPPAYEAPAR